MKKITVIGGGTGTFVVLSGLKQKNFDLSAIVTMMDSGGSTGRLRDQLGVLPPGDLRQCMVALSEAPDLWRKLFLYRFENGDLKGHNFGNIFLSALEKVSQDYDTVIDTASYVLDVKGKVIPITFDRVTLCVDYKNGRSLKGEGIIDEDNMETSPIVKAYLEPEPKINQEAVDRILNSDYIIIGPGDLYTSIIPVLLVRGIAEAVKKSKAKIIYNINLMTKAGQTSFYKASDYITDLKKYLGKSPDYATISTGDIPKFALDWYKEHWEVPVKNDLKEYGFLGNILEDDLVNKDQVFKNDADMLTRSMLRHDIEKLTNILLKIINPSKK